MKTNTRFPLLLRYPGGKHYAIDLLYKFWGTIKHTEYREPFAGGATVFFNKIKTEVNWLNDLDGELITTFKIIAEPKKRNKLLELIKDEIATPERWREVMNLQPKNDLEKAFKYYYLNRTSFSGKLVSAAWGYRPKRSLPPERWCERIIPCGEKLNNVRLTAWDFEKVIKEKSNNKVLMYVDPPYYTPPKHKHYRHGLDKADHYRLSKILKETEHQFFLTYDAADDIKEMYNWANVYPVEFFYRVDNAAMQAGTRKKGFELVITNFDLPKGLFG